MNAPLKHTNEAATDFVAPPYRPLAARCRGDAGERSRQKASAS